MSRPYAQHLGPLWPSASDGTGLGNAGVVVPPCTDPACPVDGCRTPSGDEVNKPSHYTQGDVECIDAIEAAVCKLPGPEAFLTGQVIKYVWRWRGKGGLQDLLKAEWYLKRLIKRGAAEANTGSAESPEEMWVMAVEGAVQAGTLSREEADDLKDARGAHDAVRELVRQREGAVEREAAEANRKDGF